MCTFRVNVVILSQSGAVILCRTFDVSDRRLLDVPVGSTTAIVSFSTTDLAWKCEEKTTATGK
jgi:hypothetical protein